MRFRWLSLSALLLLVLTVAGCASSGRRYGRYDDRYYGRTRVYRPYDSRYERARQREWERQRERERRRHDRDRYRYDRHHD